MSQTHSSDFLLICALDIEYQAVQSAIERSTTFSTNRSTNSIVAVLPRGVVANGSAVVLSRPGRVAAALATSAAVQRTLPSIVLLVGVAGAFRQGKARLGDIVVAESIIDYEHQKISDTGAVPRHSAFDASVSVVSAARRVAERTWWTEQEQHRLGRSPSVWFGDVMSGDKVVASDSFANQLQQWRPTAIGVEMEGAGVAAALESTDIAFGMIRGVADFANKSKSDRLVPLACSRAAEFSLQVLIESLGNLKAVT
jgi:nucleoside phosphorylase